MQPKGGPRLLVTDRDSAVYLEHARLHVEGGRIVYHIEDDELRREFNIPHANLAVLFLGQGTSITQDAMRLLAEEGVHVAVTGTGGTPVHLGSLTTYTATRHFRDLLPIYLSEELSLIAAKALMRDRVERMKTIGTKLAQRALKLTDTTSIPKAGEQLLERIHACGSIQELLGVEGAYAKANYGAFARLSGLDKAGAFRRVAGGDPGSDAGGSDPIRQVNRFIDHGNYLCYGMAGAALWALGIPPHMSVLHGKTRAGGLIFDLADSFKDALVLPLAFGAAKRKEENPEQAFRAKMISALHDRRILSEAIGTVERMLDACRKGRVPGDA